MTFYVCYPASSTSVSVDGPKFCFKSKTKMRNKEVDENTHDAARKLGMSLSMEGGARVGLNGVSSKRMDALRGPKDIVRVTLSPEAQRLFSKGQLIPDGPHGILTDGALQVGDSSWSEISVTKNARLEFSGTEEWTIGPRVEGSNNDGAAGVANADSGGLPDVAFSYYVVTVGSVTTMDQMTAAALGSGQEDQYLHHFEFLRMNTKTVDMRSRLQGSVNIILFENAVHAASATHVFMKGCMPVVNLLNLKFNMQDAALVASVSVVPSTSCIVPYSILHGEPHCANDILKKAQVTGMTGSLSVVGESVSDFVDLRRLRTESVQKRKRAHIEMLEKELAEERKDVTTEAMSS
ncbi:gyaR [Symbiodinium sp. CCMP2592]|nr:gyaR [Symbiodinium sp. CCMP2592]